MSALGNAQAALSHDNLQTMIEENLDRATIYRILNRLHDDGVVHRIVADDGKQYFALCADCSDEAHQHDHYHFRCQNCDTVECLASEISVKLPPGYQATNFNGVISGLCARCATRTTD